MFIGKHSSVLNNRGDLSIPPRFQEMLKGDVYITQGFDRNLLILTANAFNAISQHITSLNIADPLARLLLRLIFGSASLLELNESGQFQLPENLVNFAGLKEKIVIVGQGAYCEVWSQEQWVEQESQLINVTENSKRFSSLTVATHQPGPVAIE